MTAQDEPRARDDLRALLLDDLDHDRRHVTGKVTGMSEQAMRGRILPPGWTPAQLLNHLARTEQLLHVPQEYARHAEQLDIVAELLGRAVDDGNTAMTGVTT